MLTPDGTGGERLTVRLRSQEDVVILRQRVREKAVGMSFSLLDQTKIVTAASEIGRNAVIYGGGGEAIIEPSHNGSRGGIVRTVTDHVPGIPTSDNATRAALPTRSVLWLAFSGTPRFASRFEVRRHCLPGPPDALFRWK